MWLSRITSYNVCYTKLLRLVEIFNKNGIKGTFNLNSGKFGLHPAPGFLHEYINDEEVVSRYTGHDVAVHSVNHPWLQRQSSDMILSEVIEDRRNLENLVGYPVKGT